MSDELDKEFSELLVSRAEGKIPPIVEITTEKFHAQAVNFKLMPIGILAKIAAEDQKPNNIAWVYYLEAAKSALSESDYDTLWNLDPEDFPSVVMAWVSASGASEKIEPEPENPKKRGRPRRT
jgi:hypothetical protein